MRDTIDMAREAGFNFDGMLYTVRGNHAQLAHLEALVRADEREACAKVCEELLDRPSGYQGTWEGYGKFKTQMTGQECAAAIRVRSNT